MKFKVTIDEVLLENETLLHKGEYKVHSCEFDFSNEYEDLTKKALFTNSFGKTYQVDIVDNKCDIPYEILKSRNAFNLGVYGYEADGDTLVKRYSPKPISIYVNSGSYIEDVDNTNEPTPTVLEQLDSRVSSVEKRVASGGLYKTDIVDNLTSENTNMVLSANQGRILNENIGKTNSTVETLSTNVEANTSEINGVKDILTTKANTSDIPDTSSFITKAVNDLENYYLKSETYTKDEVNNAISIAINSITNGDEVSY